MCVWVTSSVALSPYVRWSSTFLPAPFYCYSIFMHSSVLLSTEHVAPASSQGDLDGALNSTERGGCLTLVDFGLHPPLYM